MLYMCDTRISFVVIRNESGKLATTGEAKWGKVSKWKKQERETCVKQSFMEDQRKWRRFFFLKTTHSLDMPVNNDDA